MTSGSTSGNRHRIRHQPHPGGVRQWPSLRARALYAFGAAPRRIYVVRKTRREVIEMITAWAALESMAVG